MKLTNRSLFGFLCFLGVWLVSTSQVRAQVPQLALDSGIELLQGATIDKKGVTTVKAPARFSVSTATLLKDLAVDETLNGTWFNATAKVPANAKLVVNFPGPSDFSSLSYKVVSGTNAVDVSNVLSASPTGTNQIASGAFTDAGGPRVAPFNTTEYQQYTIIYDGRKVGGKLFFTVTGLAACSTKAAKPNAKTGKYVETDSFSLINGTGSGKDGEGTTFLLAGVTVTAIGSAIVNPAQPGIAGSGSWETSIGDGAVEILAPPPVVNFSPVTDNVPTIAP